MPADRVTHKDLPPVERVERVPCTRAVHVCELGCVCSEAGACSFFFVGLGGCFCCVGGVGVGVGVDAVVDVGVGVGISVIHLRAPCCLPSSSGSIAPSPASTFWLIGSGKVEVECIRRAHRRHDLPSAPAVSQHTWYISRPPISTLTTVVSYPSLLAQLGTLDAPSRRSTSCIALPNIGPKTAWSRAKAASGAAIS